MNQSFGKYSKFFFWIAGILTFLGSVLIFIMPVEGFKIVTGLTYLDKSPQLFPVVGHWGIMVAGIGVLLFVSGNNKAIRKPVVIYSTIEKSYMVFVVAYCVITKQTFATSYYLPLAADGLMVIGGLWYLIRSKQLTQN
jgi:hypothetical protein